MPLLSVASISLLIGFATPLSAQQVPLTPPGSTIIDGDLILGAGDTLEPGIGAFIVNGNLMMGSGSNFAYDLSTDDVTSTSTVTVNGNVTLGGATLNVGGEPSIGYHRLISYTGSLSMGAGDLVIGQTPNTTPYAYNYTVDSSVSHAVDMLVTSNAANILQTWDGGVAGGTNQDGIWNSSNPNWTGTSSSANSAWAGGYAIFRGLGGVATIDGAQSAVGLQFAGGNYRIDGAAGSSLNLVAYSGGGIDIEVPEIRVLNNEGAVVSASITGTDGLQKTGDGLLVLWGNNTYSGNTYVNGGILQVASMANLGSSANEMYLNNAMLRTANSFDFTQATHLGGISTVNVLLGEEWKFTGGISGDGMLVKDGSGTLLLSGANSWSGGTWIKDGTLQLEANNYSAMPYNPDFVLTGGLLDLNGVDSRVSSLAGTDGEVSINSATLTIAQDSDTTFAGRITGNNFDSNLIKTGAGTLTLTGNNAYFGNTIINGGALAISDARNIGLNSGFSRLEINNNASLVTLADVELNRQVALVGNATIDVLSGTTLELSGVVSGNSGGLQQRGQGTLLLEGVNTYRGATDVYSGLLVVNGSTASSSLTSVHSGATVGGTGTVGNTLITGGTLSAGNSIGTLNIAGDLQFTSSSIFHVEVSPTDADRVNVSGQADLGNATVHAAFDPGQYVQKRYTILNAAGGLGGSRFGTEATTDLPENFVSTLRYDNNNVFLDLEMYVGGLNQNQQNVSTALVNYFDETGQLPVAYAGLEADGLTMASGELATAAQQTTVDAMSLFMNTLTDPLISGRSARNGAAAGLDTASFEQRWNVWGAGYGGTRSTDGNVTVGSHEAHGRVHGILVGADYLIAPDTIFGFAIAGGGTSFSLENGLGSGKSDLFQAGIYGRHNVGNAYITGAFAYGWQNIETNRSVALYDAERLNADYNITSWSGRVEAGYRFDMAGLGVTPYASGQFVHFDLPAYAETAYSGGDIYALGYSSKRETVGRSELGVSFDKSLALADGNFNMRTRVAWARNFNNDRDVATNIIAMPGAGFVVNGAAQPKDVGRASVSAEMSWNNGLSLGATILAEFSGSSSNYTGKGMLNYRW